MKTKKPVPIKPRRGRPVSKGKGLSITLYLSNENMNLVSIMAIKMGMTPSVLILTSLREYYFHNFEKEKP